MKIGVQIRRRSGLEIAKKALISQAREIVLRHALGAASVAYQIYPVGPESAHLDGTPHTRDTFAIALGDEIIATQGEFWEAVGTKINEGSPFTVRFLAAGASFFVEFGTIYQDPNPVLRMVMKQARQDIGQGLREINLGLSKI